MDRLRRALYVYDRLGSHGGLYEFVAAARLVSEGEPIQWCEEHRSHMSGVIPVCEAIEGELEAPVGPCRMVERLLVEGLQ